MSEPQPHEFAQESFEYNLSWPRTLLSQWYRTSLKALKDAETALLQKLSNPYNTRYVNLGPIIGDSNLLIWTYSTNERLDETPIVLLHGFGSGSALWALNLDGIAATKKRPVYAFDLPGFGRSSRPHFSNNPTEVEEQFVSVIEAWRHYFGFDKIILLGHSFGAFLSVSYALKYPDRVDHLICADPWGFNKRPQSLSEIAHIPVHHRAIVHVLNSLPLYPLSIVRLVGPLGPKVIQSVRGDLISHFRFYIEDAHAKVPNYIFHCNARNPTGEGAFCILMDRFGWAKHPLCERIHLIPQIPLTVIYGSKSWVNHLPIEELSKLRSNSYFDHHLLEAGHHVYADKHEQFNTIVNNACLIKS